MTRGMFEFLRHEPSYTDSNKDWYVELIQSTCFWYDLLLRPPNGSDTKQHITDYLKQLQAIVESQLEKRFIYFLAARKKIRFCETKKPRYSFFGNDLVFYVEIGRERLRRKVTTRMVDVLTGQPIKPAVDVSDRFITFQFAPNHATSMSIHDFLQYSGVEIGIDTEVHYVGYTKNPSKRPIDGAHTGLSRMLHRVSNEEYDFFVFFNLFKVTSVAASSTAGMKFCIANSMIDEIKVDEEGRIIEKALIKYFNSEIQEINRENENAELGNSLERLAAKNNIKSVTIHIEMEEPSETHRFFSRTVNPSDKHVFTCRIEDGGVEICEGSNFSSSVPYV